MSVFCVCIFVTLKKRCETITGKMMASWDNNKLGWAGILVILLSFQSVEAWDNFIALCTVLLDAHFFFFFLQYLFSIQGIWWLPSNVDREELFISVAAITSILPVWVAKYAVKAEVLFKTDLNRVRLEEFWFIKISIWSTVITGFFSHLVLNWKYQTSKHYRAFSCGLSNHNPAAPWRNWLTLYAYIDISNY